ncbi:cytidylate kinase [Porphyromonas crevioricanis]|uniref:Cytidylate kinase n=1 Tax=Porphyromonas crevioricanis TaxID=393921 RepID=A0A0A2FHE0_9PORP|nr:(d)CMP kinase [Porphyromonas crevioricanis]KGN90491.1 cytidylate kinase [Porphyromonas crevioricanis]KGN96934.1 cytidylate kinase [Porphyromonas crevioricanis]GAD07848.1 cytidylate kinase [Porphyromonas crevioricanis JCM 13913]SQH73898.1 Cytidylate kinase [Porphyromonas crevioricanis]
MKDKRIIIAIDGHSSCGKSTMARDLAKALGYVYIDTGAMYRAVTLYSLQQGLWTEDGSPDEDALQRSMKDLHIEFQFFPEEGRSHTLLNGIDVEQEIRSMEVSSRVSPISAIPFVRSSMVSQQQAMGKEKGIVMDGRDIGTTVFPRAEMKVFVTARPEVRAQRRLDELRSKGNTATTLEEVLANINERDYIDSHRAVSPLVQAQDALVLDNSQMTIPEQSQWLIDRYKEIVSRL